MLFSTHVGGGGTEVRFRGAEFIRPLVFCVASEEKGTDLTTNDHLQGTAGGRVERLSQQW